MDYDSKIIEQYRKDRPSSNQFHELLYDGEKHVMFIRSKLIIVCINRRYKLLDHEIVKNTSLRL